MNLRGKGKKLPFIRVKAVKVTRYVVVDRRDVVIGNKLFHYEIEAIQYLNYLMRGAYGQSGNQKQITGNSRLARQALSDTDTLHVPMGMRPVNQGDEQRREPTFTPHAMPGQPPSEPIPLPFLEMIGRLSNGHLELMLNSGACTTDEEAAIRHLLGERTQANAALQGDG